MKSFTRRAQASDPNQEAFDKYFPADDSDRKMFEPQNAEKFMLGDQEVSVPSTSEGYLGLEKARAEIDAITSQWEKRKQALIRGIRRGFLGKFEAIMQAYPYFETKMKLAQMPTVTLKEEYFDALIDPSSEKAQQARAYADFFNRAKQEVETEFENFLKELIG